MIRTSPVGMVGFDGLSSQTMLHAPKLKHETQQIGGVLSSFTMSSPLQNVKAPCWRLSGDDSGTHTSISVQ